MLKKLGFDVRRVLAIVIRYLTVDKRDIGAITQYFYWPTMDLVMWGIAGYWMVETTPSSRGMVTAIILAQAFWNTALRGSFGTSLALMEEIWSQNLLNVFATPLRVREWLAAACVTACIRGTIPFLVVSFVAYFLFGANVLTVGWFIIPFVILMLMSSWWIGLVAAWFIISFGRQVAVLIWALGWFFGTFCGLWGPVSILPRALQYVAWSLPMTYVFESLRALILNQPVFLSYLVIAFVLNLLYLSITIYVFRVLFNYSRSRGFTRLM